MEDACVQKRERAFWAPSRHGMDSVSGQAVRLRSMKASSRLLIFSRSGGSFWAFHACAATI